MGTDVESAGAPHDRVLVGLHSLTEPDSRPAGRTDVSAHPALDDLPRLEWSRPDLGLSADLKVKSGTAVLTVRGELGARQAIVCRTAVMSALHLRVPHLILDLKSATVDDASVRLLIALGAITARHGVTMWVTGVRSTTRHQLVRVIDGRDVRLAASVELALGSAGAGSPQDRPSSAGR